MPNNITSLRSTSTSNNLCLIQYTVLSQGSSVHISGPTAPNGVSNIEARNTIVTRSASTAILAVAGGVFRTGGSLMVSNSTFLVTSATSSFRIVGLVVASTVVEGSVTQLLLDTIYCQDREDVMVAEAVDPSSGSCILLQTIMVEDRATLLIRRISSISIGAFRAVQLTACITHNATLHVAEASTITLARQPMTAGITVYTIRPIILVNCILNNTNVTLLDRSVAVSLANLTLNVSLALLLNTTLTESTLAVSDVILPVHTCNDTAAFMVLLHLQNFTVGGGLVEFQLTRVKEQQPTVCTSLLMADGNTPTSVSGHFALSVIETSWGSACSESLQCVAQPLVTVKGLRLGAASNCTVTVMSSVIERPNLVNIANIQTSPMRGEVHVVVEYSTIGASTQNIAHGIANDCVVLSNVTGSSPAVQVTLRHNSTAIISPSTTLFTCARCSNVTAIVNILSHSVLQSNTWLSPHNTMAAACLSIVSSTPTSLQLRLDHATVVGGVQLMQFDQQYQRAIASIDLGCSQWARHAFSPLSPVQEETVLLPKNVAVSVARCAEWLNSNTATISLANADTIPTTLNTSPSTTISIGELRTMERVPSTSTSITTMTTTTTPTGTLSYSVEVDKFRRTSTRTFLSTPIETIFSTTNETERTNISVSLMVITGPDVNRVTTWPLTRKIFSSMQLVGVIASVVGAMSVPFSSSLVRTAFRSQLTACDGGSAISGDASFTPVDVGATGAPGHGYRSTLAGLLIVVLCGAALGVLNTIVLHIRNRNQSWSDSLTSAALPGWWLGGPCAAAVAPLLSASVALVSVSSWDSQPAADVILVLLSLLTTFCIVIVCVLALRSQTTGGWFVSATRGFAPPCIGRSPSIVKRVLRWSLDGGYLWSYAPTKGAKVSQHPLAFGRCFVEAYGSLFESMRPRRHWYFLVDMGMSIVMGLIAAVPAIVVGVNGELPTGVCSGALYAATAVQCAAMIVFAVLRPAAVRWELLLTCLMYALATLGAILASIDNTDAVNVIDTLQLVIPAVLFVVSIAEYMLVLLTFGHLRRNIALLTTERNATKNVHLYRRDQSVALRVLVGLICDEKQRLEKFL